ncbi:MAG: F-type H+-transporting ATPase subunit gamma [Acidobacteriota bacterium]|jgi:F-type H+-transporting ATPase subunit gamma|nr:F-type H+-transporting ATPase subunit gamma [Acidobacteriota bacterium]
MPSTIDIRRRIRSVKNTQQITKAMKMVAAAKLRRAQERMMAARPYSAGLRQVLASLAGRVDLAMHPLLQPRETEEKVLFLVVTADRGLCGAFNTNVLRAAQNAIAEKGWPHVELLPIGRKANDFFRRRELPIRRSATQVYQALSLDTAREIAQELSNDFVTREVDAVYVIYNEFKSIMTQRVTLERLLPLEQQAETPRANDVPEIDYLYEPGPEQILNDLLPKHIEFQLYRILLESAAAEQGARMTAMESATKNASEMISHLTLTYNRIRQAAITKEIIEIVSGAAAASN